MKTYKENNKQKSADCRLPTVIHKFSKIFSCFSLIIIISLSSQLTSCEKKTNWNLNPSQEQFLIVDGTITNELRNHSVNLSLSVS